MSFVFLLYLFNLLLTEAVMVDNDMLLLINLYTFINTILIYSIADYIIKPDKRTKWEVFFNAAPIGKNKIVGEKYIFDYIFVGIGIFTSFVLIAGVNMLFY